MIVSTRSCHVHPLSVSQAVLYMDLPDKLQHLLYSADAAVIAHPDCHLPAEYRRAIYTTLILVTDYHVEVRAALALITAEYVLPIWDEVYPDDPFPENTWITLEEWLNGLVDDDTIYNSSQDGALYLERIGTSIDHAAFFAAGAVIAAVFEALGRVLELSEMPMGSEDAGADIWEVGDTAGWAVTAYAGVPSTPKSDAKRRRVFWHWWLTQAIPAAWNA
jgi:hypothetical protein